jgi:hypothetical protein
MTTHNSSDFAVAYVWDNMDTLPYMCLLAQQKSTVRNNGVIAYNNGLIAYNNSEIAYSGTQSKVK